MNNAYRLLFIVLSTCLLAVPAAQAAQLPGGQPELPLDDFTQMLLQNLSEEEKNAVFEEAERMIQEYESLAGDEAAQQAYLENLERQAMEAEQELGNLIANQEQAFQPALPVEPYKEPEVVKEEKLSPVDLEKLSGIRTLLNNTIESIHTIITRTETSPRVSKNTKIEHEWLAIKDSLLHTRSLMQIIVNNDELIKPLLTDEFKVLKGQLEAFNRPLVAAEKQLKVADTAGLGILFGDDAAQQTGTLNSDESLLGIIALLQGALEEDQLLWGMKRLLQKYAPQELKKEEAKRPQQPTPATTSGVYIPPTKSTPGHFKLGDKKVERAPIRRLIPEGKRVLIMKSAEGCYRFEQHGKKNAADCDIDQEFNKKATTFCFHDHIPYRLNERLTPRASTHVVVTSHTEQSGILYEDGVASSSTIGEADQLVQTPACSREPCFSSKPARRCAKVERVTISALK